MIWNDFNGLAWLQPGMVRGLVLWIFVISGVVALIVWLAGIFRGAGAHPPPKGALDVQKLRDAKAVFDREQLDEMKRELQS